MGFYIRILLPQRCSKRTKERSPIRESQDDKNISHLRQFTKNQITATIPNKLEVVLRFTRRNNESQSEQRSDAFACNYLIIAES